VGLAAGVTEHRTISIHLWRNGAYEGRLTEFRQDNAAAAASGDYRSLERQARSMADQWATYWIGRYGVVDFEVRVIDTAKDADPWSSRATGQQATEQGQREEAST